MTMSFRDTSGINLLARIYAANGGIFSFSKDMVIIYGYSWTGNPVSFRNILGWQKQQGFSIFDGILLQTESYRLYFQQL